MHEKNLFNFMSTGESWLACLISKNFFLGGKRNFQFGWLRLLNLVMHLGSSFKMDIGENLKPVGPGLESRNMRSRVGMPVGLSAPAMYQLQMVLEKGLQYQQALDSLIIFLVYRSNINLTTFSFLRSCPLRNIF